MPVNHHPGVDFAPADRSDLATFDAYLTSLTAPIDSYLEGTIIASDFFRIRDRGREVGYFAINSGRLLAGFHLVGPARRAGQATLAAIRQAHRPSACYVPTCDEFLLSHALDVEHVLKRQAYFFAEAEPGPVMAEPGPVSYRPATGHDVAAIVRVSGDFLDHVGERVGDGEIHVGYDGDELVAVGIAEPSQLVPGRASIGMFTAATHRRRGIGTMTLRYLRNRCHADGITPIAGCWYYNINSKLTLEAAGMVTSTRLLRIELPDA